MMIAPTADVDVKVMKMNVAVDMTTVSLPIQSQEFRHTVMMETNLFTNRGSSTVKRANGLQIVPNCTVSPTRGTQ